MWSKIFILLYLLDQDTLKVQTEEVIVTSSRLTAHVLTNHIHQKIDTSTLYFSRGITVGDALMKHPFIFAGSTENFAQDLRISMRGYGMRSAFGIRGIKIVVDGIPESTPDGQGDVDNIESNNITHISLRPGPANGIYSNATGGVMELKTYEPSKSLEISFSNITGSFGLLKNSLFIGSKSSNQSLSLSFSGISFDGYRQHSQHCNYNAQVKWVSRINSKLTNQFITNGFINPYSQDPGGLTSTQVITDPRLARDQNIIFNAGEGMRQAKISNILQYNFTANSQLLLTIFGQQRDFENRLAFRGGGNVTFERKVFGLQTIFKSRGILFDDDIFQLGIERDWQNDDRQRYDNLNGLKGALTLDQLEKYTSTGSFLTYHLRIKKWDVSFNTRYEGINIKMKDNFLSNGDQSGHKAYRPLTGSLNTGYKILPFWYINAGAVAGFETPTLTEIINNPEGQGFADINPAKTRGIEVMSQVYWAQQNSVRISLFGYHSDNELLPYQIAGQAGRIFFRNGGASRRQGVEFESNTYLSSYIKLIFSGTYAHYKFKNTTKETRIPGIPQTLLRLGGLIKPFKRAGIMMDYIHTGDIMLNDDNSARALPQHNIHIHAEYDMKLRKLTITPSVGGRISLVGNTYNNLLINAQSGRYYEPLSPSSAYAKLVIRWN